MSEPIVLAPADYWELRALMSDLDVAEAEAVQRIGAARQRRNVKFEALAEAHGFDPKLTYRWDDATCALVAQNGTGQGK